MGGRISLKKKFILVAQFGKTKGTKGKIFIKSFLSNPIDLLMYKDFFFENFEQVTVKFEKLNNKILGKIEKIITPEDAQKFVGKYLYLDRKSLPKLKKNEFYYDDLEKLDVFIKDKKIGKIKSLNNHGAGDYLEVAGKQKDILVPYNFDHIIKIDIKKKKIFLNPDYYDF